MGVPAQQIIDRINRENGVVPDAKETPWPNRAEREDETQEVDRVAPSNSVSQTTYKPTRKVLAALVTGLIAIGTSYLARYQGIELDPQGVTTVTAALMGIIAYLVPERATDN